MPAFRYEAVDAAGSTTKGVLNADSAKVARADLRAQGLLPVTVQAIAQQTDAAGNGRPNVRISELEFRILDRALIRLHDGFVLVNRGRLRVELLLRYGILSIENAISF